MLDNAVILQRYDCDQAAYRHIAYSGSVNKLVDRYDLVARTDLSYDHVTVTIVRLCPSQVC